MSTTIPEETLRAAEKAAWAKCTHEDVGDCWEECTDVRAALAAAVPLIEQQLRQQISAEVFDAIGTNIYGEDKIRQYAFNLGISFASDVVGGSR